LAALARGSILRRVVVASLDAWRQAASSPRKAALLAEAATPPSRGHSDRTAAKGEQAIAPRDRRDQSKDTAVRAPSNLPGFLFKCARWIAHAWHVRGKLQATHDAGAPGRNPHAGNRLPLIVVLWARWGRFQFESCVSDRQSEARLQAVRTVAFVPLLVE
jgi:hypothetical protein